MILGDLGEQVSSRRMQRPAGLLGLATERGARDVPDRTGAGDDQGSRGHVDVTGWNSGSRVRRRGRHGDLHRHPGLAVPAAQLVRGAGHGRRGGLGGLPGVGGQLRPVRPLSATAPAAAAPRLSGSSCPGFVRRRSGRPAMPSRPASPSWPWPGAGAGAGDAVDEKSRVSASRYASVHMAALAGRLSAAPGCGSGCPRDRGRRSRECRTAARPAPGRPRLRWPAPSRRCR